MKFCKNLMQKIGLHFQSLRLQLIVFYTIVSILVLSIDLAVSYVNIMNLSKEKNEKFLLQQFSQSDYNISNTVNEVDRLSKLFIDNPDVQTFMQDNPTNSAFSDDQNYKSIISRIDDFISNYSNINSIYLFTKNGRAIGSNSTNTYVVRDDMRTSLFFSTKLYRDAQSLFPKISLGGCSQEKYFNPTTQNGNRYIISVARAVKPILETQKSATLVINIRESYITSIYKNDVGGNDKMYIIDHAGNIVSNNKGQKLGHKSPVFPKINFSKRYGSVITNIGKVPTQVVYYRLKHSEWYLIDEMPLTDVYSDIIYIQKIFVLVFTLSFALVFILSYIWLKKITKPIEYLSEKIMDVGSGNLGVTLNRIPKNEIGILINRFNQMSLNIDSLVKRNEKMQEEKISLELEILQAQINPHFIYNTINMIKWMATMSNAKNIEKSLISLGKLLIPIFRDKNRMWPVHSELLYLENYLDIMNWRYGNTLTYEFIVPDDISEIIIPKFTLQPIIENSVSYGQQDRSKVHIVVKAYSQSDEFYIVVCDNGNGIEPALVNQLNDCFEKNEGSIRKDNVESVGLNNVNRRIKLNFGDKYGLRIESTLGEGTRVFIHMPLYFQ